VARELNIPVVIVPANPGVTSALGCLLVDIRHDLSQMYNQAVADVDHDDLQARYAELEEEATRRLQHEGVSAENAVLQRRISMRYLGQWRSLTVDIGSGPGSLDEAVQRFHEQHEREFAFRRDEAPVEIYLLELQAVGTTPKPAFTSRTPVEAPPPQPTSRRQVWFEQTDWVDTPVYDRDGLPAGPPRCLAQIDEWGNIRIHLEN
jgi:N-methylhydantoinase A